MPQNQAIAKAYLAEATNQLEKATGVIRHCLNQLNDEQLAWRPQPGMNSIGNLVRHLCGNVEQWIIAGIGEQPDTRDRPKEFSDQGPFQRQDLTDQLEDLLKRAAAVLSKVSVEHLLQRRTIQGFDTTGLTAIFDSVAHFKGHTQEIVALTRTQLGDQYEFECDPATLG